MNKNKNSGFALMLLLIVLAIAVIWGALYLSKQGNGKSVLQTGQDAIEQTKENNQIEIQQHQQIEDQLNGN